MPRSRWLLSAVALATAAVGCAHCDTCDDFPLPCTAEGGCGEMAPPIMAPGIVAPQVLVGAPTMMAAPASVVTSQPAAGSGTSAGRVSGSGSPASSAGGSNVAFPPPLPPGSGRGPLSPPQGGASTNPQ